MGELRVEALCKGWDFPVIDRLSLTVKEGEFFVVVGPSGIGKTTLLRLTAGLEKADAGRVLVDSRDITSLPPYRRNVAMTFESYALYPHLTVYENIASPLRARRRRRRDIKRQVREVAELLRIEQLLDRYPGEISGGQKQRTALGRTLVAKPDVFLLDEPISHLDAKIRHQLRLQFHQLQALRSVATLYVTHDYAEALSLGDRIGVMGGGGLVQIGSAREVFKQPVNRFVAQHLGQPTINIVPAQLAINKGEMYAQINQGLSFRVAPQHSHLLARNSSENLEIGIRPQYLKVIESDSHGALESVRARVEIFEALGATGVLVADVQGTKLTALTSPDRAYAHGDQVTLALDSSGFLYFDPDDGSSLLLQAE